jgi:hypothetical protein
MGDDQAGLFGTQPGVVPRCQPLASALETAFLPALDLFPLALGQPAASHARIIPRPLDSA